MIDKKALSKKLNSLAASELRFDDGARIVAEGGSDHVLQAILDVIDETVLERKLTFQVDRSYVTVIAGGRRLQGITKLSGDIDGALKVIGKILSHEQTDVLESVAHVMTQLSERPGTVTVRSEHSNKMGAQTDAGVGAALLADLWDAEPEGNATPMGQFIINCGASVQASLVFAQGEIVRAKGDKAIQDKLQDIANDQWTSFEAAHAKLRKSKGAEPKLVCLNAGLDEATTLGVAKNDEEFSVFVFTSEDLTSVYSAWRDSAA